MTRSGTLDARRFLIRRAFKIWPSYLVLVAWIFVSESQGGWKHALRVTLPNLLHVLCVIHRLPEAAVEIAGGDL